MELELRVVVRGRFLSVGAGVEIPELYRECFAPMDVCTDSFMAELADNGVTEAQAKIIMKTRDDAAEILSAQITEMLVAEMKKNDTKEGY